MTMNKILFFFFFLPALALGCAAETATPQPDPTMVHRTVVKFDADGHETVAQGFVHPHAESTIDLHPGGSAGLAPASVSQDLSCAGASLWAYSDINRDGAQICFQGTGTASLWRYQYPHWDSVNARWVGVPWTGAVRSYYPGENAGGFTDSTCTSVFCTEERFPAWGPPTNAGATARAADTLCVGPSC